MRILHIIPTYKPAYSRGGPIWSVSNLNEWLVKKGIDVTVYTTDIDVPEDIPRNREVDVDGVKTIYFPFSWPNVLKYWRVGFLPALLPRRWEYSSDLHRHLSKHAKDFDLIHITSTFLFASTLGRHYAKKFNKPFIISPRGNLMWPLELKSAAKKKMYINIIEGKNLASADAIHFTVPKEKDDYIKYSLPFRKYIIIPNGIEDKELPDSSERGRFRKKFKIPGDKSIVLFLGRINWKKGLDTLIPAFGRVVKERPNTVLVLAGGTDGKGYEEKVKRMISENGLEIGKNIVLTGMILREDKNSAYEDSNLFVLPSYSENFGMAVVEAMYKKLPVIVTPGVGISPWVKGGNAGLVIKKNVDKLAESIIHLIDNKEENSIMGENGRKLVKEEFEMSKIVDKFVDAYQNIIDNHRKN